MFTREQYEELEKKTLAPYAVMSGDSEGRLYQEEEHPQRSRFQRDRDRVIHSRAFRRLEYKTQVFVNYEGDYYRTRLTHSLEVSQIARSIARMLQLNEDLAEVISLAHDLGHTPFGHSGQNIMAELMKDDGGFEHNQQSFRVVTFFEDQYLEFPGLNLTVEVLEGIAKHQSEYDLPDGHIFARPGFPSLEAQLCNVADEIAYNNHDVDDGLKAGILQLKDLRDIELWENHFQQIQKSHGSHDIKLQMSQTVRLMINTLVTDLVKQTTENIESHKITSLDDVRKNGKSCVCFSEGIQKQAAQLKSFLYQNMYRHPRVKKMGDNAAKVITALFRAYQSDPQLIPKDFLQRYEHRVLGNGKQKESTVRIICDYIAGMTDRFALEEHKKLL